MQTLRFHLLENPELSKVPTSNPSTAREFALLLLVLSNISSKRGVGNWKRSFLDICSACKNAQEIEIQMTCDVKWAYGKHSAKDVILSSAKGRE